LLDPEVAAVLLAAAFAGALALPELRYVLKDSDARALLFSEPFLPMYEELKGTLQYAVGLALHKAPAGVHDYEQLLAAAAPLPCRTRKSQRSKIHLTLQRLSGSSTDKS